MIFVKGEFARSLGLALVSAVAPWPPSSLIGSDYPFRMMWFTPVVGILMVVLVSLVAAALSARSALKLEPIVIFASRSPKAPRSYAPTLALL